MTLAPTLTDHREVWGVLRRGWMAKAVMGGTQGLRDTTAHQLEQ